MSAWSEFLTEDNFQLALERILRSKHHQNKDRIGLRVFSANLEANLTHLINHIQQETYRPSHAEKIYTPKRSGTVRTFPVLSILDRVVYQAIINILVKKSKAHFESLVETHVFAPLSNRPDSKFLIRRWDGPNGQYRQFLGKIRELWRQGYHWVVQADIASYYDSIDHELLCNKLNADWLQDDQLVNLLCKCLRVWTSHETGIDFPRGIPQGYEASDYLASLYLFPTDERMIPSKHGYYIRYVDDIRIFAKDRDSAHKALHELDMSLKRQALILQPDKTGAREATDINDLIDELTATLSLIDFRISRGENVDEDVEELFLKSWQSRGQKSSNEGNLIFALNRLPQNFSSRDAALSLLREMPWRSNNFANYLSEFIGDEEVIDALLEEIRSHKVYAWHLANCLRALASIAPINVYRDICRDWISSRHLRWYQRLAAVESLQHDTNSYSFLLVSFKNEPNYLIRSALLVAAAQTASNDGQRAQVIRASLKFGKCQVGNVMTV